MMIWGHVLVMTWGHIHCTCDDMGGYICDYMGVHVCTCDDMGKRTCKAVHLKFKDVETQSN